MKKRGSSNRLGDLADRLTGILTSRGTVAADSFRVSIKALPKPRRKLIPKVSEKAGYRVHGGWILHLRQGDPAAGGSRVVLQESTSPQGGIPTLSESKFSHQANIDAPPTWESGFPIYNHARPVEVPSSLSDPV